MKDESAGTHYQVRGIGHLDQLWSDWFDGVKIEHDGAGHSTLTIVLPDQAALMALLQRLHHLAVTITDVTSRLVPDEQNRKTN